MKKDRIPFYNALKTPDDSCPLISVIIPVFNGEAHIDYCLHSVVSQTYHNLEIIIVNDGSTDDSLKIIRKHAAQDARIRLINQINLGVSAARNNGLTHATGEYVGFVDADDWIAPELYSHLLWMIETYDADLSETDIIRTKTRANKPNPESVCINTMTQTEYMAQFFKIGSQETKYYTWNKLFKRALLTDDIFPHYEIGEDVISTFRACIRCERIVSSDASLYYYHQGSGATSQFNERYFQLLSVWDDVAAITDDQAPQYAEWAAINQARIRMTVLSELAVSGAYCDPQYTCRIKELLCGLKKERMRLLKAPIAFSRKAVLLCYCLNYQKTAWLMNRFIQKQQ